MEEQILELLKSGETYLTIQNRFHVNGEVIGKIAVKHGVDRGRKKQNDLKKIGYKRCSICFEIKPIDEFPKRTRHDGTTSERFCIKCSKTNLNLALSRVISSAKYRATKKKIEFNISSEYVLNLLEKQNGKCFYSGKQLGLIFNENLRDMMSIDRIDSSRGYTADNIVLCCAAVNSMKNSMTIEEMVDWCTAISENMKGQYVH